ncbi:N-acetyl-alpha-D-glucosaminyl L-malate synthase BshA [Meiothermus hypogaeus]|uniref:Glycosyl transferase n=2 Tax=Meiothermus hypogaeus TaxID=884155 RepID=A0A511R4P9_9DEIN|nr:N-acetyl-alpha-D-glucosaminyl L-malate synthase BshA [Meiothermus hypogaeus]RIH78178.1 N-acetyl-alpha-D-glucosaminyl L-malate synthase [Meiothermus hypogaeus]GEM84584.1 glycosyl transferase [Meiothermus hypogaeus NBRC 106114]
MRIGVVCYPGLGGSGIVASELADRLARRGHRVFLFATELPMRLPEDSPVQFMPVEVPNYPVFPAPLYTLALAGALERAVREEHLELIHTHYAIPHAVAAKLATEGRIPLVHTLHGTDVTLLGIDPAYQTLTSKALQKASALTAVSQHLAQQAQRTFGVNPQVIYNAVDTQRFRPNPGAKRFYAAQDEFLLVHASNFRAVKRVGDIIHVFAKIRQKLRARLVLVGTGPERAEALSIAHSLGVDDSVTSLATAKNPEEVIGAADVFLLASEYEGFGQSGLEALACGVPVVATRVGGIPEWLTPEVGRQVEFGDLEAFAQAVVELLSSPHLAQMREAARQYAQAHFNPETITDQYERVYASAMQGKTLEPSET